jgi:two-component system, NtrC family, sensor kinase
VRWEEFAFRTVVDSAVAVIQPLAQKKGLEIVIDVAPEIERVWLDPGKMRQVLYNLMSNAVKFTEKGTIRVEARLAEPGWMELAVADTGIGIAAEDQPRIFREFEQVDGSYTRRYEGTGLGLALTKKFVEMQGGTIRVDSEVGRGSRFVALLPIGERPKPPGEDPPPSDG